MADFTKFVVISYGKNKNSYLQDALGIHPNIYFGGALLEPDQISTRRPNFDITTDLPDYMQSELWGAPVNAEVMAKGFLLPSVMLKDNSAGVVLDYLKNEKVQTIYYRYQNPLNMVVSRIFGKGSKRMNKFGLQAPAAKISMTPTDFAAKARRHDKQTKLVQSIFQAGSYLEVTVEEMAADPKNTMEKIEDFLALPTPELAWSLIEENTPKIIDPETRLSNYTDLVAFFQNTPMKAHFKG